MDANILKVGMDANILTLTACNAGSADKLCEHCGWW